MPNEIGKCQFWIFAQFRAKWNFAHSAQRAQIRVLGVIGKRLQLQKMMFYKKALDLVPKNLKLTIFLKFCILAGFLAHYSKFQYTNTK